MEEMSYVFLFMFFPLPLIFTLVAASISHLLTTATLLFIELFYIGMPVVRADGWTGGRADVWSLDYKKKNSDGYKPYFVGMGLRSRVEFRY